MTSIRPRHYTATLYEVCKEEGGEWVVLFGALKVLWKDNVSTKYVADCRYSSSSVLQSKTVRATRERAPDQNLCCLPREDMARKSLTKDGTKLSRRGIF